MKLTFPSVVGDIFTLIMFYDCTIKKYNPEVLKSVAK